MAISLYDVSISTYLQVLGGVRGVLDKGEEYARNNDIDLMELVESSLYPDMRPLRFQVICVWHHSLGAIRGIQEGLFTPPPAMDDLDYGGLRSLVETASTELQQMNRQEIDSLEGRDMTFKLGDFELPFTTEDFILSFSLPNFYFHATTTYDLLRTAGVPLGKLDYLGQMRVAQKE